MNLRQKIELEIREHGPIPFSHYMGMCLYDPEMGYYSRNPEQFGKAGDFYTASDVHAVFGRLLARQFEQMWRASGSPERVELLELGPGRGFLAQDLLDWSEKKFLPFFHALHYTLAESSPALRGTLRSRLAARISSGKAGLAGAIAQAGKPGDPSPLPPRTLTPETPLLVLANEFFDALPVEVLSEKGALRVDTEGGRFIESWGPAAAEELAFLDRHSVHPEPGERTEACFVAQHVMAEIAASVQRGFVIVIDYGYTRDEQLAGRHLGTVMTYRRHSASPNPYEAPGEQDITAHVNFSALAAAAEQNGMQPHTLLTQSQFLMGVGEANQFADAFEECRLPQERAKVALQLKHLVTPAGMGEIFHVLVASKGVDRQTVEGLSGLAFGKSGDGVPAG